MNIIKKHWGILLCALVFLVLLGILLADTVKNRNEYQKTIKEIEEQEAWFDKVNKDGWKLSKNGSGVLENVLQAERNQEIAEEVVRKNRQDLYQRFAIRPELPPNPSRAQEMLDQKLSQITTLALKTYKLDCGMTLGGKLAELNQDNTTLTSADFLPVFRQAAIYEELIRHLGKAGVKRVEDLDFPRSLQVEEADGYTITPITLSFYASPAVLQKLINDLLQDRHMLFFLRAVELEDENIGDPTAEYSQIALVRRQQLDAKKPGASNNSLNGMGGMSSSRSSRRTEKASASSTRESRRSSKNSGLSGSSSRSSRTSRSASRSASGLTGMGSSLDGIQGLANINEAMLVYEEPKRQDNFIFRPPRSIRADLTLDLIEYTAPEAE